jgi:agmatinase
LKAALDYLADNHEIVGFDLVEVNPLLDVPARNTSYLAAQIITTFMGRIVENPSWKTTHNVSADQPTTPPARRPRRSSGRTV